MEKAATILKYMDVFGIKCTFYSEKMPKLYTITGGIFSIISFVSAIIILYFFSKADFQRTIPITSTLFAPSEGYKKIKFEREKIWIPWRIVDYNNNEYINHTGLLFPIIYYFSQVKNPKTNEFDSYKKLLNYKLCNETSMAFENYIHSMTVPLNQIYCIDTENLDMGGSWITEFINYIQFDLYYCQNGSSYIENNPNCTSFTKIKEFIGEGNSLEFDLYYPIVQFQPENITNPIAIIYQQHFYHLSKYVNKIERLYLQEHELTDDLGWILKNEINSSYWGLNSISGESYFNGEDQDLPNEGSNSRAYSFNVYLKPGIIHYKRQFKKIYTIFSDYYPVAYIIFIIMKSFSKFFKKVENNKKMIELLFENLKEKPNEFEEKLKRLETKLSRNGRSSFSKNINELNLLRKKKLSVDMPKNEIFGKFYYTANNNNLNNINNINNFNNINIYNNKEKRKSFALNSSKHNLIFLDNSNQLDVILEKNKMDENPMRTNIIKNKKSIKTNNTDNIKEKILFHYKYYLFSVFVKNLNISKKSSFFSARFAQIYLFFCQLFDITTYLSLLREFNALKKVFNDKNMNTFGKNDNKKVKVSFNHFIKEICEVIEDKKFHI